MMKVQHSALLALQPTLGEDKDMPEKIKLQKSFLYQPPYFS